MTKRASLASISVAPKTRALAYADFDSAAPARQQEILAARKEVVFSADCWYDDKSGVYTVNVDEETKTYQEIPKFGELCSASFVQRTFPRVGGASGTASYKYCGQPHEC